MPKRTYDGIKKRCDCARRSWPKCAHSWHFSFHHGARSIGTRSTRASSRCQWAELERLELGKGRQQVQQAIWDWLEPIRVLATIAAVVVAGFALRHGRNAFRRDHRPILRPVPLWIPSEQQEEEPDDDLHMSFHSLVLKNLGRGPAIRYRGE